jgi:hypothetical protein
MDSNGLASQRGPFVPRSQADSYARKIAIGSDQRSQADLRLV